MSKLPFQPLSFCGLCALCFNCGPKLQTSPSTFSGKNLNRYCRNTKKRTACFGVIPNHNQKPSTENLMKKKSPWPSPKLLDLLLSSSKDNTMIKGYSPSGTALWVALTTRTSEVCIEDCISCSLEPVAFTVVI